MPSTPQDFASLLAEFQSGELQKDIQFLRALRNFRAATTYGEIPLTMSPGAENILLDLRGLAASGAVVAPPELPSQAGHANEFLVTTGSQVSWRPLAGTRLSLTNDEGVATGGVGEELAWDQADYNRAGNFSPGAPTRLTIQVDGIYQVCSSLSFEPNGTGERYLYLLLNGNDVIASEQRTAVSGGRTVVATITNVDLVAGDYIEARAYHTAGSTLNVLAELLTNFSISRLG